MPTTTLSNFEKLLLKQVLDCLDPNYSISNPCEIRVTIEERTQLTLAWLMAASVEKKGIITVASENVAGEVFGVVPTWLSK
jgi:hypothetical protein